jgi:hypothetical protein
VLDGVDQQVAQDPLHPPPVDLGNARVGRQPELDSRSSPLGELLSDVSRAAHEITDIDELGVKGGGLGVVPADLQQVDEQRLEPAELALQQLGRTPHLLL